MARFIISLGIINKKLLIPSIYTLLYILVNIYYIDEDYNEVRIFVEALGMSIGEMSIYFTQNIFKYRRIATKKKKRNTVRQYVKDYSILFFFILINILNKLSPFYIFTEDENSETTEVEDKDKGKYRELFMNDALEIVFMTLVTYFLLKYKYYIHHFISIIMLIVLCIINDAILENFTHTSVSTVFSSILYILADSFIYSYFKYLISNRYYHFVDVYFMTGIFDTFYYISSLIIVLTTQYINGTNKLIFQFFEYYNEYGASRLITIFLFTGLLLKGILMSIFDGLIVSELTPNYCAIVYELGKIPTTIYSIEGYKKWIILVLSIFQILSLLFYLEILEYNFCSLNKNTKKSIEDRVNNQLDEGDNYDDDEIDMKGYDISESIKIQKNLKEIKEMRAIFEDNEDDD